MQIITAAQCRAARALLDWNQPILAGKCGLHVQTISAFEKGAKIPSRKTLETIFQVFTSEGILFYDDDGVQRKSNRVITLHGQEGFTKFMWDVYETAKTRDEEICVSNVDEAIFTAHLSVETDKAYMEKMVELKKEKPYIFKILIKEGDYNFEGSLYGEYRWTPKKLFRTLPFYVYGNKLGFLFMENGETTIHVIEHPKIAEAQRIQFNLFWDQALIPDKGKYKPEMHT